MVPNRILKESICTSENIDGLTAFQETFFYRLIVNCDDYGRMDARPKILASALFPLKNPKLSEITKALHALAAAELVILYEAGGKPYLQMKSWGRHQKIRALRSRYPAPDGEPPLADGEPPQASADTRGQMSASADGRAPNPIQNEQEKPNPKRRGDGPFEPPSPEDVRRYCREKGYEVDAERFCDFYAAKGWRIGQQPMVDWQAAVRAWTRQEKAPGRGGGKTVSQQQYTQREYVNNLDAVDEMMRKFQEVNGHE